MMKELLARTDDNFEKIFTLSYVFRDEPKSPIHRSQFLMIEWYRKHASYDLILKDCQDLIRYLGLNTPHEKQKPTLKAPPKIRTIQEIFLEYLQVDILDYLDVVKIKELIKRYPEIPLPHAELEWDDYYFLLYLNKIEPELSREPILFLTEFPAPLSALSKLKSTDPRVCLRFELYLNGVEICNCFEELTDLHEQKLRFLWQSSLKKSTYNYELPSPERFYRAFEKGFPESSGVALGVERLISELFKTDDVFFD